MTTHAMKITIRAQPSQPQEQTRITSDPVLVLTQVMAGPYSH